MANADSSGAQRTAYDSAGVHIAETETALTNLTARLRRTWPGGKVGARTLGGVALDERGMIQLLHTDPLAQAALATERALSRPDAAC